MMIHLRNPWGHESGHQAHAMIRGNTEDYKLELSVFMRKFARYHVGSLPKKVQHQVDEEKSDHDYFLPSRSSDAGKKLDERATLNVAIFKTMAAYKADAVNLKILAACCDCLQDKVDQEELLRLISETVDPVVLNLVHMVTMLTPAPSHRPFP